MKKLIKKGVLLLISMFTAMLLVACSSESPVNSTLDINDDMSGSKTLVVEVSTSQFNEYFNGTFEDLVNLVNSTKPEALEFSFENTAERQALMFTLNFSSIEDYDAKVNEIIGGDETQNLEVYVPDGMWGSGASVYENIKNTDLLEWLSTAIVDAGYVDSSNSSYIFENGEYTLRINGTENTSSYGMDFDNVEYGYVGYIKVTTNVYSSCSFDRTYEFYVYNGCKLGDKEALKAYFQEKIGDKGTVELNDTDEYSYIYSVKVLNLDAAGIKAANEALFTNSDFSLEYSGDNGTILSLKYDLNEKFDVAEYLNPDMFFIDVESNYEYNNGYDGNSSYYDSIAIQDDGTMLFEKSGSICKNCSLNSLNSTLEFKGTDSVSEKFEFEIGSMLTDEEAKLIENAINLKMGTSTEAGIAVSEASAEGEIKAKDNLDYSVKINTKEGVFGTVEMSGNISEAMEGIKRFTGQSADISYVTNYSIMKPKFEKVIEVSVNLSEVARYSSDSFSGEFIINTGSGSKVTYCSSDTALIDKNTVTAKLKLGNNHYQIKASGTNVWAIIIWLVIIALVLGIAFVVIKKTGALDKAKDAANKAKVTKENAGREADLSAQAAGFVFCSQCGTKTAAGTINCPNCGSKL